MKTTYRFLLSAVIAGGLCGNALAQERKNVILYIGDGYGLAPKTAARMAMGQGKEGRRYTSDPNFQVLAADKLRYNAMVTTHSLNSWVTDSAPGSSVYACGPRGKGDNEAISIDVENGYEPIETILEAAKKEGYAVGLVTTTRITHATPAAFATHIWNRDLEDYIAAQYISHTQKRYEGIFNLGTAAPYNSARDWELPKTKIGVEVDVLLGGGSRHFLSKAEPGDYNLVKDAFGRQVYDGQGNPVKLGKGSRTDGVDLVKIAKTRGYLYVNSRDALNKLDVSKFKDPNAKLLGLFRDSHMSYEQDRQLTFTWEPSLYEMTQMAIKVLTAKGGNKGFFLLVEGGRIDHMEHANVGAIGLAANGKDYQTEVDQPAYADDGVYALTPSSVRVPNVYGSDYLIKEVLAFDYAIEEGRKLLGDQSAKTLIFTTADHECGGLAVVGLHDEATTTKVRTYAKTPSKPTAGANPQGVVRGEAWYPEYNLVDYQGKYWPQPASPTARRIVIAFGSNPTSNGNGLAVGGTPGNHTPQDIWVGGDDNVGGDAAAQIVGQGLLDNTYLTHIMSDFLLLNRDFKARKSAEPLAAEPISEGMVFPNPTTTASETTISFTSSKEQIVKVLIYNTAGQLVKTLLEESTLGLGTFEYTWDGSSDYGGKLQPGMYHAVVTNGRENLLSKKIILSK